MSKIRKSLGHVSGTSRLLSIVCFALTPISLPGQARSDVSPVISVNQLNAPEKARNAMQKAVEAWHLNKLADANIYIDKALRAYPRYAAAFTLHGIIAIDSDPQQASEDIEKAIEYDPNYVPALLVLGTVYNRLGRFDDAARTLDRALLFSPTSWQGYYEMSVASLGKNDFRAALRLVEKASSLNPTRLPGVHMVKGLAFFALHNKTAATSELTIFLEEAPNDRAAVKAREILEKLVAPSAEQ